MKPNKFTNDLREIPVHTSGFAEVSKSGIGSLGVESFDQRKQQEQNRRLIRGYSDSHIGRGYGERPSTPILERPSVSIPRQGRQSASAPATSYREPPARGYNPYA